MSEERSTKQRDRVMSVSDEGWGSEITILDNGVRESSWGGLWRRLN
jgi:hypothetical protein